MNVRGRTFNKRCAAAVLTGALLLNGCAVIAVPDRVPMQKGTIQKDLAGASLVVLSSARDASPFPILTEKGVDVGFVGNRQAWSRKLADALSSELARKGAALRATASLKLSVAVTAVTLEQTGEINRFTVKISASSSRGWAKDYEASAEATTGFFETVDNMTRRLAGLSVAGVVKVMLDDPSFMAQFGTR
jgi:hypothetical protein